MPDITNLATNTTLNAKMNEVKGKIPNMTALTATAENKIPNVSNLVKKTAYNTNISEIENKITDHNHDKYITTQEFNKLMSEKFASGLAQANLASKNDIAALVKKTDFDDKLKNLNKEVTSNKSKHLLVENEFKKLQDKIEKLQTFDSSQKLTVKNYIFNDGVQF